MTVKELKTNNMPDPLNAAGNEQTMPEGNKTYGYTQKMTKIKKINPKGASVNDFDDTVVKSPVEYTPYKMQADNNDPMTKNYGPVAPGKMRAFGTKDSENPDDVSTTPGKFTGDSPAKGLFGAIGNLFGGNKGGGSGGGSFVDKIKEQAQAKQLEKQQGAFAAGGGTDLEARVSALEEGGGGTANVAQPNVADPSVIEDKAVNKKTSIGAALQNLNPFNAFSDIRLKEKIEKTGKSPSGIPTYEFNYIGDNNRYSGVMAQDLIEMNIDAVSMDDSGFYTVNYNNIDVDMHLIN